MENRKPSSVGQKICCTGSRVWSTRHSHKPQW